MILLLLACGRGEPTTVGFVELAPDTLVGRDRKRMNVDQVQASIERVTGGSGWVEQTDSGELDLFDELAGTLGKPDYLSATDEDTTPGLLFQKFLDDAAVSACTDLVEREAGGGADAVFLVHADLDDRPGSAAVEDNLRHALLRFHGRRVPAGDPSLEPWLALIEEVEGISGMQGAWRVTCVGLVTHPDFYTY